MYAEESDAPLNGADKPPEMEGLFEEAGESEPAVQSTVEKAGLSRDDHRDALPEINL